MSTQFDSNTFEHDFILSTLQGFASDLSTEKPKTQVLDKYACILTAFMAGQIVAEVKRAKE